MIWIFTLAPSLFLVNSLIIGIISTDYSIQRNSISSLVHGNLGYLQVANFVICGLLSIGLAYWLGGQHTGQTLNLQIVRAGVLVFGLSLVLLGIFPTDKPGVSTLVGQIHGAIFILSVLIQAALQFWLAKNIYPSLASVCLLAGGALTATGLLGMFLLPDIRGLVQRVLVATIVLWISIGSVLVRR